MTKRLALGTLIAIFGVFVGILTPSVAFGSTVIASFELDRDGDFDNLRELGVLPFYRIGNVFFAEVDQEQFTSAQRAGIPTTVIDDQPFSQPYYAGTIEALPSLKIPSPDLERLTEVGEHAFYKAIQPLDEKEYHQCGFEPQPIGHREIPLVRMPTEPLYPNPKALDTDPDLLAALAAIDQDSIFAFDSRLMDFQTRLCLSDSSIAARDWIVQKFHDFGYTNVSLDQFYVSDNRYGASGDTWNIVCVKQGSAEPDKVIVIGGHWDSIVYDGNDPWIYAPGADDNGSGTAATLEIARVLAGVTTKKTIHFVPFGAEENGLNGSWHYAEAAYLSGLDIELMINMDMIGYTIDAVDDIECSYLNNQRGYADLMGEMASAHTSLSPYVIPAGGSSDHYPFGQYGFNVANTIEGDFNTPGWHTGLDLTSEMDFPYYTEVVKMCLATLYTVANYPASVTDAIARDVGDGQSLQTEWTALNSTDITGYWVYWGEASQNYDDSVFVAGVSSSQVLIAGLVQDQLYYLTVVALDTDGRESFVRPEITATPRVVPLPPTALAAEPEVWQVRLDWTANQEMDFSHYNLYRGTTPGVYSLLQGNLTALQYIDTDVSGGIVYEYVLTAVDGDLNESGYSAPVNAAAATFDQGILILDATIPGGGNPTLEEKENFYNNIFGGAPATYLHHDPTLQPLNKTTVGQYQAIFYIDDNNGARLWSTEELDILKWYLSYNTNLVLGGWRLTFGFAELGVPKWLGPGHFLYDYCGINYLNEITDIDLQGGLGQLGYSNFAFDPNKVYFPWQGKMGWIGTVGVSGGGQVIYKYDSYSGTHTGENIGARRDNGTNKFAYLSFPFYYLQENEARTLVSEMLAWFGIEITCDCSDFCDLNADGDINPVDVVYVVNFVYQGLDGRSSIPACLGENGDWNCDGEVDPVDVVYYVNLVYRGIGTGPCDPCLP